MHPLCFKIKLMVNIDMLVDALFDTIDKFYQTEFKDSYSISDALRLRKSRLELFTKLKGNSNITIKWREITIVREGKDPHRELTLEINEKGDLVKWKK